MFKWVHSSIIYMFKNKKNIFFYSNDKIFLINWKKMNFILFSTDYLEYKSILEILSMRILFYRKKYIRIYFIRGGEIFLVWQSIISHDLPH